MEGFIYPTKAQKLSALADALRRVYAKHGLTGEKLFEDQLQRLEEAERGERRPDASK